MSDYTTPISTAFELQRTTIKQGQQAVERSLEFQRNVNEAMLGSLDTQEDAQRSTVELYQEGIHTYLDAVEASVPGASASVREVRRAVDDGFETLFDQHSEAFEQAEELSEEGFDTYEEFSQEYLDAMNEQLSFLLDTHEELEGQTVDAFEQSIAQYEQMQEQMEGQSEEFQQQFEEQTRQFQEQFERQIEQFQEQMEELQTRFENVETDE